MNDISDKELEWLKAGAELRGKCDYCEKKALLSYNRHGLWNCFECEGKIDETSAPKEKEET